MALVNSNYLKKIMSIFPSNYCFSFAYGSGVFKQAALTANSVSNVNPNVKQQQSTQPTPTAGLNMIDLIIVVTDGLEFHKNNLSANPSHYSMLKNLGPKTICKIQNNFGARVYFNSLIPIKDENGVERLLKYGVIDRKSLINDLLDWDWLYISGRLHKPVKIIHPPTDEYLAKALSINHQNALCASLLLLSETFTEEQLYTTIANLSYNGDFRMIFGEDKNKVAKIVKPNIEKFRNIYQPYLGSSIEKGLLTFNSNQRSYFQDLSPRVIFHNLSLLPKIVQQNLYFNFETKGKLRDLDDVLMSIAQSYQYSDYVRNAISQIVWRSSWPQSLKGLFTAGLVKSIRYSSRKVMKMRNS